MLAIVVFNDLLHYKQKLGKLIFYRLLLGP